MNFISVYTRTGDIEPSGYYRVLQYLKKINDVKLKENILLSEKEYTSYFKRKNKVNSIVFFKFYELYYFLLMNFRLLIFLFDDLITPPKFIVVSRVFIPRRISVFHLFLIKNILKKSKMVWDFDDHILESNQISKRAFISMCKMSSNILVTHNFLKGLIPSEFKNKVIILDTTDGDIYDESNLKKASFSRKKSFENSLSLAWIATSGNIPHLMKILPTLDITASKIFKVMNKTLVLNVVCDIDVYFNVKHLKIQNIRWTRERAKEVIFNSHVGIMPLNDSEFIKGKGGFKLIQYMASGLPVIGSNLGYNKEIIDESFGYLVSDEVDWDSAILNIGASFEFWESLSMSSVAKWRKDFNFEKNLNIWRQVLDVN